MSRLRPFASLAAVLLLSCGGDPAPANACATNPCLNGGTCSSSGGVAVCACAAGFGGTLCGTVVANPCSPNPCQNGGTCAVSGVSASCTCTAGFAGATCTQHAPTVTAITPPASAKAGVAASFSATINDPDSLVTSVAWAFGDGGTSNDTSGVRSGATLTSTVSHTYSAAATVSASSSVTAGGATSSKSVSVTVAPGAAGACTVTAWDVTQQNSEYDFSGVTGANPAITVCKGQTFTFHLKGVPSFHPFCIWNAADQNSAPGVTNNCATGTADVVWAVPAGLTTGGQYRCQIHGFGSAFTIQ